MDGLVGRKKEKKSEWKAGNIWASLFSLSQFLSTDESQQERLVAPCW